MMHLIKHTRLFLMEYVRIWPNYQNNYRTITWYNVVPGDDNSQCSHRSELCCVIDAIRHIDNICSTYNVLEGSADIGFNILEAYKVANRYAYSPYTKLLHYDLSSTLHQLIKKRPLSTRGKEYTNIAAPVAIKVIMWYVQSK